MSTPTKPMTTAKGLELAAELIVDLTPLSGDRGAVDAALRDWLADLDANDLSLVCTAAVRMIFADCLTPTPVDQLPPDRLVLAAVPPTQPASA